MRTRKVEEDAKVRKSVVRKGRTDSLQEGEHQLGLAGVVALVVVPENLPAVRVHYRRLDGSGTHVHANGEHQTRTLTSPFSTTTG